MRGFSMILKLFKKDRVKWKQLKYESVEHDELEIYITERKPKLPDPPKGRKITTQR